MDLVRAAITLLGACPTDSSLTLLHPLPIGHCRSMSSHYYSFAKLNSVEELEGPREPRSSGAAMPHGVGG